MADDDIAREAARVQGLDSFMLHGGGDSDKRKGKAGEKEVPNPILNPTA